MANLDVTELLSDPDFCDSLAAIRRVETIGPDGRAVFTTTTLPFVGVVQAPSAEALQLMPDDANQTGAIQVHTTFRLQGVSTADAADQVAWQNQTYTVAALADYTNYGAGFVSALCTLNNLAAP